MEKKFKIGTIDITTYGLYNHEDSAKNCADLFKYVRRMRSRMSEERLFNAVEKSELLGKLRRECDWLIFTVNYHRNFIAVSMDYGGVRGMVDVSCKLN